MKMLPLDRPSPRLLNTVEADVRFVPAPASENSALSHGRLFAGNGLAVFVGLVLACLALAAAGWLHQRHTAAERAAAMAPMLTPASTGSVSPSEPTVVQISADHIRVAAIALGHPRLAVINGQQVGEGDFVTVHAPTVRFEIKLRVMKIADGAIELSDGSHTIVARLAIPSNKTATP